MTISCYLCNGESTRGCVLIFNTVKAAQAVNISKILSLYCTIAVVLSSDCFASCGVMASSAPYKQDLPPKGGYAPINFRRIPARQVGLFSKPCSQNFLCPGSECPNHLHWPHRLHGGWSLALQEGDAHMEDMGESCF